MASPEEAPTGGTISAVQKWMCDGGFDRNRILMDILCFDMCVYIYIVYIVSLFVC